MGRQSLGRGCSLVGAASPSTENTFPNPTVPGQEDAPLRLLESGDYRSELQSVLQTWLIVGLGELGEQASPPAWTRQGLGLPTWSREPWCGCPVPFGSSGRRRVGSSEEGPSGLQLRPMLSRLGRCRLLLRAGVGSVRWKPPHSNRRGPIRARRAGSFIQTLVAVGLPLPPPGHRRGAGAGAGEPAASVTGEQHRRLGLQAVLAGCGGEAMERSLHRVSLGSRRAHPDLSFYLTTFGKCPRQLAASAASSYSERLESPLTPRLRDMWG